MFDVRCTKGAPQYFSVSHRDRGEKRDISRYPKPKINVSLRGGTTKQSVSFRRMFSFKFIEIVSFT
jgi:hypothetical protein